MVTKTPISVEAFLELEANNPTKQFDITAEGEVIEVSPKRVHSRLQVKFAVVFDEFLTNSSLADDYEVLTECLHEIEGWICQPDVSIDRKGDDEIVTTPPLVAVEIKSDSNTFKDQRAKAQRYIELGTKMVILMFAEKQIIEVYQPGVDDQILTINDVLDGGTVLPGFKLALKELLGVPTNTED